jgi:hypothetical protein
MKHLPWGGPRYVLATIKVEGCSCGGQWRPLASNLSSKETPAREGHGGRRVAAETATAAKNAWGQTASPTSIRARSPGEALTARAAKLIQIINARRPSSHDGICPTGLGA